MNSQRLFLWLILLLLILILRPRGLWRELKQLWRQREWLLWVLVSIIGFYFLYGLYSLYRDGSFF
jgi:drug/metabolite transporter (DMT)-like permease